MKNHGHIGPPDIGGFQGAAEPTDGISAPQREALGYRYGSVVAAVSSIDCCTSLGRTGKPAQFRPKAD
jgi:hypothetical protein